MSRLNHLFFSLALLLLAVYCASCANLRPMNNSNDLRFVNNSLWVDNPKGPVRAIILMLHGLNLKPAKMDNWAEYLSEHGARVLRFALRGHAGEEGHMRHIEAQIWRKQFHDAYVKAKTQAQELRVPIYFVGFSLGALVALEYSSNLIEQHKLFDRMVLIAPAIATPWYSQLAAGLLSIFNKNLILPSRSPKNYRANKGTTVAAYEALFELKESLEKSGFKNSNVPALILIDKYDELVPSSTIRKIIAEHRLSQWQLAIVNNKFAQENYGFRHLMVDKESVGPELWAKLSTQVRTYLGL